MYLNGPVVFKVVYILISSLCTTFALTCYSCSYTYNSIRLGYECAAEPWNVTTANIVLCSGSKICYTKTVYYPGYSGIQSMVRSCGNPTSLGCNSECCSSIYDVTCQTTCNTDFCNAESVVRTPQTQAPNGNVKDTGPSIMKNSQILSVFFPSILTLFGVFIYFQ